MTFRAIWLARSGQPLAELGCSLMRPLRPDHKGTIEEALDDWDYCQTSTGLRTPVKPQRRGKGDSSKPLYRRCGASLTPRPASADGLGCPASWLS